MITLPILQNITLLSVVYLGVALSTATRGSVLLALDVGVRVGVSGKGLGGGGKEFLLDRMEDSMFEGIELWIGLDGLHVSEVE